MPITQRTHRSVVRGINGPRSFVCFANYSSPEGSNRAGFGIGVSMCSAGPDLATQAMCQLLPVSSA